MKIKDDIKFIFYVKTHAADILDKANKTRRPVFATQKGEAKAVFLDSESLKFPISRTNCPRFEDIFLERLLQCNT
ncbi:MAG: type II toxin-antitoxin system Phd/YefM family antitoxin [Candidatus Latescibacteria bacterium]|nr:type II toxin-antitoxin system Phd/YefM family antitoxin [Candidatus Latescibacterota bacterium]